MEADNHSIYPVRLEKSERDVLSFFLHLHLLQKRTCPKRSPVPSQSPSELSVSSKYQNSNGLQNSHVELHVSGNLPSCSTAEEEISVPGSSVKTVLNKRSLTTIRDSGNRVEHSMFSIKFSKFDILRYFLHLHLAQKAQSGVGSTDQKISESMICDKLNLSKRPAYKANLIKKIHPKLSIPVIDGKGNLVVFEKLLLTSRFNDQSMFKDRSTLGFSLLQRASEKKIGLSDRDDETFMKFLQRPNVLIRNTVIRANVAGSGRDKFSLPRTTCQSSSSKNERQFGAGSRFSAERQAYLVAMSKIELRRFDNKSPVVPPTGLIGVKRSLLLCWSILMRSMRHSMVTTDIDNRRTILRSPSSNRRHQRPVYIRRIYAELNGDYAAHYQKFMIENEIRQISRIGKRSSKDLDRNHINASSAFLD